ncbi:MAG: thioredoxin family protein [Pirellulaceae bacterium]|nr:thioredoxin family protein [Planctomycetales bacterium]
MNGVIVSLVALAAMGTVSAEPEWTKDYAMALQEARVGRCPMLIVLEDPAAEAGCLDEKAPEAGSHEERALARYQLCRVDVNTETGKRVAQAFGAKQFPYTVITDASCRVIVYRHSGKFEDRQWSDTLLAFGGDVSAPEQTVAARPLVAEKRPAFPHANVEEALAAAKLSHRPVVVFLSMSGCHFCDKMKAETLSDPLVVDHLSQSFEATVAMHEDNPGLAQSHGVNVFPTTLILNAQGGLIDKIDGFVTADKFARRLHSANSSLAVAR